MSGSTRSAKATVSLWKASQTTRKGIRNSPSSSFAFSISRTAMVFMVEFQAMLAMKIISVSSRYGSPRLAWVMTVCIRPCAESGCSQENAWSIRIGVPSSPIASSSGLAGKPSGAALSGVSGLSISGELKARKFGTMWRGYGALWRKPPGASMVPSTLIRMARARTVWKPFECAARPRIAWKATGRPCVVACFLPQASVQAIGSSKACSNAAVPSSWASFAMRSAGMPVIVAAHSGVHAATRSRSSWKAGATRRPSASV